MFLSKVHPPCIFNRARSGNFNRAKNVQNFYLLVYFVDPLNMLEICEIVANLSPTSLHVSVQTVDGLMARMALKCSWSRKDLSLLWFPCLE